MIKIDTQITVNGSELREWLGYVDNYRIKVLANGDPEDPYLRVIFYEVDENGLPIIPLNQCYFRFENN